MKFPVKKIHHLIRYFVIIGILSFAGYSLQWQNDAFLALNGPSIFIASKIKVFVFGMFSDIPRTETVDQYFFLMPVTVVYFAFVGFMLKQLWNERGMIRTFSLLVFLVFLGYIHYATWKNLNAYFLFPTITV